MNSIVAKWLRLSNNDYLDAQDLWATGRESAYASVCYHCHQSVEKLLKGLLIQNKQPAPKIHDILVLSNLLQPFNIIFSCVDEDLRFLTSCSSEFRYPGEEPTKEEAERALALCYSIREQLRA